MSASFEIVAATGSYGVHVEAGAFARLAADWKRDIVIADEFFRDLLSSVETRATIFYPASESIKSLDEAPALIEAMRRAGANRQTRLVALGGGVIQDLTAFAASIYMRGVEWVYVPTTILGMVDSCIGGKSSINVGPYKNLVGTFHPPAKVAVDPALARTLPLDQQASGIVEAAKICFCRGGDSFAEYLACDANPGMETDALARLISLSLRAKQWFIETDEFDRKERLLLNFGHTFGHAIEGASHYGIAHGVAVGLGMLCAFEFARQRNGAEVYTGAPMVGRLEAHLGTIFPAVPQLSSRLAALPVDEVMERFESDKKHKQDGYVLILADASGAVVLEKVAKSAESASRIRSAVEAVVGKYCR